MKKKATGLLQQANGDEAGGRRLIGRWGCCNRGTRPARGGPAQRTRAGLAAAAPRGGRVASLGCLTATGLFVKQGSKLHSKMLSKEAAAQLAVPSFQVYYSVASAGAVPFLWESQPGTPKNDSPSAAALTPPLTPPPSYYAAGAGRSASASASGKKRRPGGLIGAILRRRGGRTTPSVSSSSWSSCSSSSYASSSMSPVFTVHSSPALPPRGGHHRRAFSDGAGADDDDAEAAAPPRCFWTDRDCCESGVVKGCGVAVAVRNALATVVGGKPGRRPTAGATA